MPKDKEHNLSFTDKFCSDIIKDGMFYACTVRSKIESGRLLSVTLGDDYADCKLITAKDIPGENAIDFNGTKVPLLCEDEIHYIGEPVALVVSSSMKNAQKAAITAKIAVELKENDTNENDIIDYERDLHYGPCFIMESGQAKGIDARILEEKIILQKNWTYDLSPQYYKENCGAFCIYDGKQLTVNTTSQWLTKLSDAISNITGVAEDSIFINKTKTFEQTTNSLYMTPVVACQCALASYITKTPVSLIFTRQEQNDYIFCHRPITLNITTGSSETGKINAIKIQADIDSGYGNLLAKEIADRIAIAAIGLYTIENVSINIKMHRTKKVPLSLDLQQMDAAAFFAIENHISALATKINTSNFYITEEKEYKSLDYKYFILPTEIREMNIDADKEGQINLNLESTLSLIKKFSNVHIDENGEEHYKNESIDKYIHYNRRMLSRTIKSENQRPSPFSTPLRGIGCAVGFEGSLFYGTSLYNPNLSLEMTLETNGNLTIHCPPISPSIKNIWTKTITEQLSIKSSNIKISSDFNLNEESLIPEGLSSNISVMTRLIKKCCEAIAKRKEDAELPFTVKKSIRGSQKNEWDKELFTGSPYNTCSFAFVSVEVELDPCTYEDKIKEIFIIINGGKIVNETEAYITIKLGVQKLLCSLNKNAEIDCDNINIEFINSEEESCQIGELLYKTIPAAYTQALSQILGDTVSSIPLAKEDIYKILTSSNLQNTQKSSDTQVIQEEKNISKEENDADKNKTE